MKSAKRGEKATNNLLVIVSYYLIYALHDSPIKIILVGQKKFRTTLTVSSDSDNFNVKVKFDMILYV